MQRNVSTLTWAGWMLLTLLGAACDGSRLNPFTPTAPPLTLTFSLTASPTFAPPAITAEVRLPVPATPVALAPEPEESAPAEPPRLLIAALKIDAPVMFVPVREGEWDISQLGASVGRLETTGQRPGADWAMALVGHVSTDLGQRGPFAELQFIRPDAEIVYRAEGVDYTYVVREKIRIKPTDTKKLYLRDGAQLLLLTCTDWDFMNFEYLDRLLVRAELIEQAPVP